MTDWDNIYKIRIANPDDSFQKHEVVKLLLVMKILNKHRRKFYTKVYTEHKVNSHKCDIYFEDLKEKAVYIYEIQGKWSESWLKEKTDYYDTYVVYGFNSVNFIPINIKELSSDIVELNKQLDEFIF